MVVPVGRPIYLKQGSSKKVLEHAKALAFGGTMGECPFCWTKLADATDESFRERHPDTAADIHLYCPNCGASIYCHMGPPRPWTKAKGFLFRRSSVTGEFYQDGDEDELLAL